MARQHFDESSAASAPGNYERFFVPAIGRPLALDLVRAAALQPGERVLDVACGTGVVARIAHDEVGAAGRVVAADVNPAMVAVARASVPSDVSIEWHDASAEKMPFADQAFDVVLCQMGLQFMEDRHAALEEMRRVLDEGGRLVVNLPGPTPEPFEVLAEAVGNHVAAPAAGFVRQVFSLHDTTEIEGLLKEAGFNDVAVEASARTLHLPSPEAFLWQYVSSTPLAAKVAGAGESARDALEKEVVAGWEEYAEQGHLALPLRVVIACGRR